MLFHVRNILIFSVLLVFAFCKTSDQDLKHKVNKLEIIVSKLISENIQLKEDLRVLKDADTITQKRISEIINACVVDRDRRLLLPPQGNSSTMTNQIAFSARLDGHLENLGIHQTVKFDRTFTNVGHGWDPVASLFKAPLDGLYYFTSNVMTHHGEDIEVELVKNGTPIAITYVGNGDTYAVGMLSVVLHLSVGDDVWIRIHDNKSINDGNVRLHAWSWFTGFRLN